MHSPRNQHSLAFIGVPWSSLGAGRRLENKLKDPEYRQQADDEDDRHEPHDYFHFSLLWGSRTDGCNLHLSRVLRAAYGDAGSSGSGSAGMRSAVSLLIGRTGGVPEGSVPALSARSPASMETSSGMPSSCGGLEGFPWDISRDGWLFMATPVKQ